MPAHDWNRGSMKRQTEVTTTVLPDDRRSAAAAAAAHAMPPEVHQQTYFINNGLVPSGLRYAARPVDRHRLHAPASAAVDRHHRIHAPVVAAAATNSATNVAAAAAFAVDAIQHGSYSRPNGRRKGTRPFSATVARRRNHKNKWDVRRRFFRNSDETTASNANTNANASSHRGGTRSASALHYWSSRPGTVSYSRKHPSHLHSTGETHRQQHDHLPQRRQTEKHNAVLCRAVKTAARATAATQAMIQRSGQPLRYQRSRPTSAAAAAADATATVDGYQREPAEKKKHKMKPSVPGLITAGEPVKVQHHVFDANAMQTMANATVVTFNPTLSRETIKALKIHIRILSEQLRKDVFGSRKEAKPTEDRRIRVLLESVDKILHGYDFSSDRIHTLIGTVALMDLWTHLGSVTLDAAVSMSRRMTSKQDITSGIGSHEPSPCEGGAVVACAPIFGRAISLIRSLTRDNLSYKEEIAKQKEIMTDHEGFQEKSAETIALLKETLKQAMVEGRCDDISSAGSSAKQWKTRCLKAEAKCRKMADHFEKLKNGSDSTLSDDSKMGGNGGAIAAGERDTRVQSAVDIPSACKTLPNSVPLHEYQEVQQKLCASLKRLDEAKQSASVAIKLRDACRERLIEADASNATLRKALVEEAAKATAQQRMSSSHLSEQRVHAAELERAVRDRTLTLQMNDRTIKQMEVELQASRERESLARQAVQRLNLDLADKNNQCVKEHRIGLEQSALLDASGKIRVLLEHDAVQLNAQLRVLRDSNSKHVLLLRDRDGQISELEHVQMRMLRDRVALDKKVEEVQNELATARESLALAEERIAQQSIQLQAAEEIQERGRASLQEHTKRMTSALTDLGQARSDVKDHKNRLSSAVQSLREAASRSTAIETKLNEEIGARRAAKEEAAKLGAAVEALQKQLAEAIREVTTRSEECDSIRVELKEARNSVLDLENRLRAQQVELDAALEWRRTAMENTAGLKVLQGEIARMQEDAREAQKQKLASHEALNHREKSLLREEKRLEQDRKTFREKHEEFSTQRDVLRSAAGVLRRQIDEQEWLNRIGKEAAQAKKSP